MPVDVVDLENITSSQTSNVDSHDGDGSNSPTSSTQETASTSFDDDYSSDADTDSIKHWLETLLSSVKTIGSFATSGIAKDIPLSGLSVKGVGPVSFPLREHDARAIIRVCHRAPFGKGSETIVDESVRKTWELNPDQFEISNPAWHSAVAKLARQATRELGCTYETPIDANLYKLLLYEEGAMFKPHKDTEKEPEMFGTFVISLPSKHKGGDIVASHRGQSKTFQSGSTFDYRYTAWYADVTHEVRPVTSGHRLVLVYNLVQLSVILLAYAERYVQIEPTAPGDWARRPKGCGCWDCNSLDRFLTDPHLQSKRFPVSKSRRHHLHCMLNDTEYTHETDRKGVETLVVTKPASRSAIKFEQWRLRFSKARQEIERLDQGVLRELLGDDFVYLSRLEAARRGAEEMPSTMRRRRRAVMSRRVEVIDLT